MTEITGRDGYIQGQALIYAIAAIQNLPDEKQEYSNMLDMCSFARATFGAVSLAHVVNDVEAHTDMSIDLHFPEGDERTAENIVYKLDYRFAVEELREARAKAVREAVDDKKRRFRIGDAAHNASPKKLANEAIVLAQSRCTKH